MTVEIVTTMRASVCRGETNGLKGGCPHSKNKIPKGLRALKITVFTSQGNHTNFFCQKCSKSYMESFRNCLNEFDKRLGDGNKDI